MQKIFIWKCELHRQKENNFKLAKIRKIWKIQVKRKCKKKNVGELEKTEILKYGTNKTQ